MNESYDALVNNQNLDDIPEPFLKYSRREDRSAYEPTKPGKNEITKKNDTNYRDMLFMILVFFIFNEE